MNGRRKTIPSIYYLLLHHRLLPFFLLHSVHPIPPSHNREITNLFFPGTKYSLRSTPVRSPSSLLFGGSGGGFASLGLLHQFTRLTSTSTSSCTVTLNDPHPITSLTLSCCEPLYCGWSLHYQLLLLGAKVVYSLMERKGGCDVGLLSSVDQ